MGNYFLISQATGWFSVSSCLVCPSRKSERKRSEVVFITVAFWLNAAVEGIFEVFGR